MKVIIDRFEGNYAIVELESGEIIDFPKILVPNAKEGDIIDIFICKEETKRREDDINNLMDELFK